MNDTEISASVAALLVAAGAFLKNYTPLRNDWIPAVLMVLALAATLSLTKDLSPAGWIRAAMAGFTAVGVYEGSKSTVAGAKSGKITADPEPDAPTGKEG